MPIKTEKITQFYYEFDFPDEDFKESIKKKIKVELLRSFGSVTYGGRIPTTYGTDNSFVKTIIPNTLYDFLKDNHPDYNIIEKDQFEERKKFTKTVKRESLNGLKLYFSKMTQDAIFIKKIEQHEKLNKVIFINKSYSSRTTRDNYNHADTGTITGLSFNYFVCYEVPKKDAFKGLINEYYGLRRKKIQHDTRKISAYRNQLPYIPTANLRNLTRISWTQEKEDFLEKVMQAINKVAQDIDRFMEELKEDKIELIMQKYTGNTIEWKKE